MTIVNFITQKGEPELPDIAAALGGRDSVLAELRSSIGLDSPGFLVEVLVGDALDPNVVGSKVRNYILGVGNSLNRPSDPGVKRSNPIDVTSLFHVRSHHPGQPDPEECAAA